MPPVLTMGSTVNCADQGTVAKSSSAKLKVSGNAVLVKASVDSKTISNCPVPNTNSTSKCMTATVTGGESTKLKVGGAAVLVGTMIGQSDGLPGPKPLSVTPAQSKLSAS